MAYTRIQNRRGTTLEWTTGNPILAPGEIGLDITLGRFKLGDGIKTWSQLSFGLGSAYDVAVKNGFSGTEQQWLDSLVGSDGEPGGDGPPGPQGIEGTAYTSVISDSGGSRILTVADSGALIKFSNESTITVVIPTNTSQPFSIGRSVSFIQYGTGKVVVQGDTNVSVVSTTTLSSRTQYSLITALKVDTDSWIVLGDLAVY